MCTLPHRMPLNNGRIWKYFYVNLSWNQIHSAAQKPAPGVWHLCTRFCYLSFGFVYNCTSQMCIEIFLALMLRLSGSLPFRPNLQELQRCSSHQGQQLHQRWKISWYSLQYASASVGKKQKPGPVILSHSSEGSSCSHRQLSFSNEAIGIVVCGTDVPAHF